MMSEERPTEDPLDEAFAAYLRSCDAGEVTNRDQFLAQFPELADELRELMDAADLIGRVTEGDGGEPDAGAETVSLEAPTGDRSGGDPAATLPLGSRGSGQPGPTLPYHLGDYLLVEVLGRGGMGVVYLGKQTLLDRMVAVKMIRSGIFANEAEVRRFYMEAQAAARLRHPGIVAVYQFGRRAGHHFFSMEYIEGTDLQRLINESVLEPRRAARYVRDVAWAIHHAHQKGVLHRDLKPANVLIDAGDEIHVTDFGLAKHLDAEGGVTGSGTAVGTPHYMAPEQAGGRSDSATRRSDVYSLGAILFACLAGRPPIAGETVMETLIRVIHKPAPLLRSVCPDAPADVETVIDKCLQKNPAKRYATAEELAGELDAFLDGRPVRARPRGRLEQLWHWLGDVPLVAALLGRRALKSSAGHRRFQTAMLAVLVAIPFLLGGLGVIWNHYRDAMPARVEIAGGLGGGVYNNVASVLADALRERHGVATEVVPSGGSVENRERLLAGEVDLAPLQASGIRGETICVVAPLFYEAVHVLVRRGSPIDTVDQLAGHEVAVGPPGSGSRVVAELILDSLSLTEAVTPRRAISWPELGSDDSPRVAVICIGKGSPLVSRLLSDGRWRLIPIRTGDEISPRTGIQLALEHPTLRPMTIAASEYAGGELPDEGIDTVGTTAFLAARQDTPSELVIAALAALYGEPDRIVGLIPRVNAAEWQNLEFHPAARRFFDGSLEAPRTGRSR